MSNPTLVAQTRSEFGKGAARRARRAGLVPGVLYGHGDAPLHVDLPGHELFLAVRGQKNALVELVIEGKKHLALVKEVQRHPVSRNLLHADFLAVKAGELVDVEVPVSIIGEPAPGTQYTQEEFALLVKAPATSIPESIEVDITGDLPQGHRLRARSRDRRCHGQRRGCRRGRGSSCRGSSRIRRVISL